MSSFVLRVKGLDSLVKKKARYEKKLCENSCSVQKKSKYKKDLFLSKNFFAAIVLQAWSRSDQAAPVVPPARLNFIGNV